MVKLKNRKLKTADISLIDLDADSFMSTFADNEVQSEGSADKKTLRKKKKKKVLPANKRSNDTDITTGSNVKRGLSNLKDKDADFYKFLLENDPELLNFSGGESDGSVSLERESDEDNVADVVQPDTNNVNSDNELGDRDVTEIVSKTQQICTEVTTVTVTNSLLRKWEKGLEKNSLIQWKQLVRAFQAAVATARGDDDDGNFKYSIIDPDIINKVILLALHNSVDVLTYHLKDNPTTAEKWPKVKVTLKKYLGCLTELLGLLTSNDVLCAVMRHCKDMLPFFAIFSRHVKKYVKAHVMIWGSKAELSKVVAFTGLKALVTRLPSFLEDVIKKMYVEYSKCSKAMNIRTRDSILLMRNCLVDMFKINPPATYNMGFLSIRELAVTLRSATMNKKKQSNNGVYNWQYVNSLHVWVEVLSDCDACLQPLIYPLIQVMFGVLKLHTSPCYHPLKLHVMRLMLHLSHQTNKHIPLIHPLLGILEFCSNQSKAAATKPIDLTCVLKVTKGYKKTKAYQDGIFDLTYELMLNYTSQLSRSISFPEVSFPITVWLKKFVKKCDSGKYKSLIRQLLEKIDVVSKDVTQIRSSVTFSPKDFKEVDAWEVSQPETTLTTYLNTWLKLHREVAANNKKNNPDDAGEDENETENKSESESENVDENDSLEIAESQVEKVNVGKKAATKSKGKKRKLKKNLSENKLNKKSDKSKKLKRLMSQTSKEIADTGDIVEDFVLSD